MLKMKAGGCMETTFTFQKINKIGHILTEFMNSNPDLTTSKFGKELQVTQSMVSKWRTDKANFRFEDIPRLFKSIQGYNREARFKIQVLNKFTNGFIPNLPDSRFVDGNPSAVAVRAVSEMEQAINAISESLDELGNPDAPNHLESIEDPEMAWKQANDVLRFTLLFLAVLDENFHFGWEQQSNEREKELAQHHYQLM